MSSFGDFVKARREELNLDQAGLAREIGVNQQTVSKWERATAVPRPERIRRIAEVLRVDVADLLRYAGYLPGGRSADVQGDEPFRQLLKHVGDMTDDQLILLIEETWGEYRGRAGVSLKAPPPPRGKEPGA